MSEGQFLTEQQQNLMSFLVSMIPRHQATKCNLQVDLLWSSPSNNLEQKKLSGIKEQPIENWATVQKQWAMIHWENWGDDSRKHQREMGIRGYNLTHLHLLAWSQRERKLNFIFS